MTEWPGGGQKIESGFYSCGCPWKMTTTVIQGHWYTKIESECVHGDDEEM